MKRILSLTLICVILVVSLSPSAFASENDSMKFIEILDICMPDGFDNTKVWVKSDNKMRTVFSIYEAWDIEYIDVLFTKPSDRNVTGVRVGGSSVPEEATALSVVNVSGDLYRAYGHVALHTRTIYIWVDGNCNWVNWESVRVATSAVNSFDETAICDIQAYGYSDTINYRPTDLINYRSFIGANDPELNMLHLYIICDNWRKYDYLDFAFSVDINAINSIHVTFGDTNVPFDVSYVDNGGIINNHFWVSVRLDLRELDRNNGDRLIVHVNGQVNSGGSNFISMDGCRGYIFGADLDVDTVWYKRFYNFLVNDLYFNFRQIMESTYYTLIKLSDDLSVSTSSGNAFKEESSEMLSGLDDISASMDAVQRPSMDSINADFTGDISNASVLMASLFSEVTGIPWLSTIILASCTLGLISYILYGKD